MEIVSVQPQSSLFDCYLDLRWELLRKPWGEPRNSVGDEQDVSAYHVLARTDAGELVGVGRIHQCSSKTWQVRYMAVVKEYRNLGIGYSLLTNLEEFAGGRGAIEIVLQAREQSVGFYAKHGYTCHKPSHILFGQIQHYEMRKSLKN